MTSLENAIKIILILPMSSRRGLPKFVLHFISGKIPIVAVLFLEHCVILSEGVSNDFLDGWLGSLRRKLCLSVEKDYKNQPV